MLGQANNNSRMECVRSICLYATRADLESSLTLNQIYMQTGYDKYYSEISQDEIKDFIKAQPDLMDAWMLFSQNKRWTPSWFFEKLPNNLWLVGYLNKNSKRVYESLYRDALFACAYMIRMEMEENRLGTR